MPFIWAKNSNLFEDYTKTSSDMFYPSIALSKKQKLSVIWLAANYDPDKYKKVVSSRDCEGLNIARICDAIMNPHYPYALRLSAQLLLGTVRVYRTKAKLLLAFAEQMMLNLSTLIKEANQRNLDLPVSTIRPEAITMVDIGMGIIDYSLEPVYYDHQMIMHLNEDDFFNVNGSPFHSPIKLEKEKKDNQKQLKSPLQVSNRTISIEEDLLSPNRPIQIPGDEDLGFGPAQENFLSDLYMADIADERLEIEKLFPVFEEDEEEIIPTIQAHAVNSKEDDIVEELPAIYENGTALATNDLDFTTTLNELLKTTRNLFGDDNEDICEESMDVDFSIGKQKRTQEEEVTVIGQPINWENNFYTPAEVETAPIVLKPLPNRPKKKRKLKVDKETMLQSNEIRLNLSRSELLIGRPIIAGTAMPLGKDLFNIPIVNDFKRRPKLRKLWDARICMQEDNYFTLNDHQLEAYQRTSSEGENEELLPPSSPELPRQVQETPGSIDIPRAGSASLQSMEQTGGSTILINQTPIEDDRLGDVFEDIDVDIGHQQAASPRISGIGLLPHGEIDVDLTMLPELEPIKEENEETILPNSTTSEYECDPDMSKTFHVYQRHINVSLAKRNDISFHTIFPSTTTNRREAALAFYACLNMHKNKFITMEQSESFGDITLKKR